MVGLRHDGDRRILRGSHVAVATGNLTATADDIVGLMYPGGTLDRLRALKRRYDPENVFSMNRNILPE